MLTITKFRRTNRILALIALFSILALILPIYTTLSRPSRVTEAAWYDDSYGFRQRISFTHNASITTDRRVSITISNTNTLVTNGQMQTDCDDSRFTDLNGKSLRFQLVSGCNSASTVYDVVFPSIHNGDNIGYFYYGNPSASSGSDSTVATVTSLAPSGSPSAGSAETGPGPNVYWAFNEGTGTTTRDTTSNALTGTLTSGPAWRTDEACLDENCIEFDGSDDFVTVANATPLNISGALTISVWVYLNTNKNYNQILTKGTDSAENYEIYVGSSGTLGGEWQFSGGRTGCAGTFSDDALQVNTWYHISVTYNGSSCKTYINGRERYSVRITSASITTNSNALQIGGDTSAAGRYLDGKIDELKIYPYARSAAQILTDYASRGTVKGTNIQIGDTDQQNFLSNGLVGYWKMDEASTNTCTGGSNDSCDSSGIGNDGAWNGNTASTAGKFGNGTSYDGSGDYVSLGDPSTFAFGSGSFTLSAWVFFSASPGVSRYIIFGKDALGAREFYVTYGNIGTTDQIRFSYFVGATEYATDTGANALTLGSWNLVTVTRDGANTAIYVNGALRASSTSQSSGSIDNTATTLDIGRRAYTGFLDYANGAIDEVRIYSRALTPSEVEGLYNWSPGPVGWWKLDENSGTSAADSSGNGNGGTLTNGPGWNPGKYGAALGFDATNDYVSIPDANTLSATRFSIAAWIKWDGARYTSLSGNDHGTIVSKGTYADTEYTILMRRKVVSEDPNTAILVYFGNTGAERITWENTSITTGWHHIGVTYDGTTARLYFDGALVQSQAQSVTVANSTNTVRIGVSEDDSYPWGGQLDDVKLYNYARSSKQVVEDMNAGHPAGGSPVASQLVHFRLDESSGTTIYNAGFAGSSLNGFLASNPNTPSWSSTGKINGSLNFNGTTQFAQIADTAAIQFGTGDFTLSAWIYPRTVSYGVADQGTILSKSYNGVELFVYQGQLRAYIGGAGNSLGGNTTLSTNQWYHVALVRTSGRIISFINGRAESTIYNASSVSSVGDNFSIGTRTGDTNLSFDGYIDEVKIYNGALTPAEIAIDANAGSSLAAGGILGTQNNEGFGGSQPIGWWKFDENTGGTAYDTSGSGNAGTLTNNPQWQVGKNGSALSFNGTNSYVDVGPGSVSIAQNVSALTLTAWVYPRSISDVTGIIEISINGNSTVSRALLELDSTGEVIAGGRAPDIDDLEFVTSVSTMSLNTWTHLAATIDYANDDVKIYINGILQSTTGTPAFNNAVTDNSTSDAAAIGANDDGSLYHLDGLIDEVRIYNYELTAAQIAYDFNRGAPIAWYKFDECQGTSAYNSADTDNKKSLTLTGTITPGTLGNTAVGTCSSGTSTHMWNDGTTGKFNSSLGFDGTDDYVSVSDNAILQLSNNLTVSAWFKTSDAISVSQGIVRKDKTADPRYFWGLQFYSGASAGKIFGEYYNGSGFSVMSQNTVNDGQWHNAVLTIDDIRLSLYVDGVHQGSTIITGTQGTPTGPLAIGADPDWTGGPTVFFFNGQIDDVRIYNYPLAADMVKRLYNDNSVLRFGPSTGSP